MKYCTHRCRDYCVYNMFRCAVVLHRSNGHETRKHFVRYLSPTIYLSFSKLLVHYSDRAYDYTTKLVQSTDSPSKHANTRTTAHSQLVKSNQILSRSVQLKRRNTCTACLITALSLRIIIRPPPNCTKPFDLRAKMKHQLQLHALSCLYF